MSPGYEFRLPSYPSTAFPSLTTAHAGMLARASDGTRGLRMFQGTDWFSLSGEVVNVKEFGAIGDGVLHPLSERFATLAAAQAVYPHATALTEQIDGVAIQAAINVAHDALGHPPVVLPPGSYFTTATLDLTGELSLMGIELVRDELQAGPTQIWWVGAAGGTMVKMTGATGAAIDWIVGRIANLTLRGEAGGGGGEAATGILFEQPGTDVNNIEFFIRLEELRFAEFSGDAIRIEGTADSLRWRNLRFDHIGGAAISISSPPGMAIVDIYGFVLLDVAEGFIRFDTPVANSNFEGTITLRSGYLEDLPLIANRGLAVTVDTDNTSSIRYNYNILLDTVRVVGTLTGQPMIHNKGTANQDNFSVTCVNTVIGNNTWITGSTTPVPLTPTQRNAPLFVFAPLGTTGNGFSLVRLLSPVHVRRLAIDIESPTQLTANAQNYNPGNTGVWRLTSNAIWGVGGIAAGWQGLLTIINVGSFGINIFNEDAGSTAANRIITGLGGTLHLRPGFSIQLLYDVASSRWRVQNPQGLNQTYTQTFATADRTLGAYTADNESGAYTGIDNAQAGTVYATVADLNALRTAYENLRAFTEDAVAMLNALVDDHQTSGFVG